ncbi:acyl-CoA dehydrogenase family protein [Novosphingobium arvoryzae]|uniref:Acyl-CoA dehydrogenase n=1 Tax=Novosphingobium arvoryzae TaxID=1256514 RepID=A0A918VJW3_9SPHN|nr:acyl-CoA dehydrogenase family protein [Novosphingobium arvoryzae]GHA03455.1 acyl-CoA dehydrogenase [Novosphingobium arvoryzae]
MPLDLPLDDNQTTLRDGIARYLADHNQPGWTQLAGDLGLMSIGIPESAGGFGGGATERALAAAALGPTLAAADWLPHVLAAELLARAAPDHAALPALALGQQRIALVDVAAHAGFSANPLTGIAELVAGAGAADWALVLDDSAVQLVRLGSAEAATTPRPMLDGTARGDIAFAAPPAEMIAGGNAAAALAALARDALIAGRCAEACGLMRRMLDDTVAFLGQRQQFGQPIARFQVLRHRVADMQMTVLKAAALTEVAVQAETADPTTRRHAVSAAAIEVIDAVRAVGEGAVQMHGAMGLTGELTLGRFYKRGLAIGAELGPARRHFAAL